MVETMTLMSTGIILHLPAPFRLQHKESENI